MNQPLGSVIEGSLSEGLEVRLHPDISVEEMRVGKFLVVQGSRSKFFCLLTDVSLGTSTPRIFTHPPDPEDDFWREVLAGSDTYGTIEIAPMLMLSIDNSIEEDSPNTITLKNAFGEFESQLKLLPVKKPFLAILVRYMNPQSRIFARYLVGKMIPIKGTLRSGNLSIWKYLSVLI